jgi:hypothetical protein
MTAQEIIEAIHTQNDQHDLMRVMREARARIMTLRAVKAYAVARHLRAGMRVTWQSRTGGRSTGLVREVRRTRAVVETSTGQKWIIPMASLTVEV